MKGAFTAIENEAAASGQRMNATSKSVQQQFTQAEKTMERYQTRLDQVNKTTVETNKLNRQIASGQFAGVSTKTLDELKTKAGELDKAVMSNTKSMGMWGQAFKGAFVGAIAGMTFATIIGSITSLIGALKDAAVNAVKFAGDFEATTNAMIVFTGSAGAAKAELADIDALARRTTGLRMVDAEAGAIQLRGLGFAAKTAQDLLAGLAKQRTLNPAIDDAAVAKVIRNITQLSEGSPRAGQDIREMIAQMPTLNRIINDTFGSQQKFQQLLKTDSRDAIKQFTEALAKTQGAAGGLNNAFAKLEDAWISTGRAFGEPFVEPLTLLFQDLTGYLYDNEQGWRSWGQTVADTLEGAIHNAEGWSEAQKRGFAIQAKGITYNDTTVMGAWGSLEPDWEKGLSRWTSSSYSLKDQQRFLAEIDARRKATPSRENETLRQTGERLRRNRESDRDDVTTNAYWAKHPDWIEKGYAKPLVVQGDAFTDLAEKNSVKALKFNQDTVNRSTQSMQRLMDEQTAINQSGLNKQLALRDSYLRNTTADERQYSKEISQLKLSAIKTDRDNMVRGFDAQLHLNRTDFDKVAEINEKKNRFLITSDEQYFAEKQAAAKRDRELERQLQAEQRRDMIEFNNLTLRAAQQMSATRTFDIERQISLTERGYNELIDVSRTGLLETTRIISENMALQLQDQSLTAQQRVNIETEANLSIQDAAESHRQKIIAIQDRQHAQAMARIEQYGQRSQQAAQLSVGFFGMMEQAFSASPFFGETIPDIGLVSISSGIQNDAIRTWQREVGGGTASMSDAQMAMRDLRQQNESLELEAIINFKNSQIAGEKSTYPGVGTARQRDLEFEVKILENRKNQKSVEDAISNNLFKQSNDLITINEQTAKLKSGSQDIQLLQIATTDYAKEYRNVVMETRTRELVLGDANLVQGIREIAILKEIANLREAEFNAVLRIDKAQLELSQKLIYSKNQADAGVLEFLAQQPGITDIIKDTKINMLTTAYSGLDAVAGRLTRSFGAFRDVIKDLIANLIKLALNSFFGKMFGKGAGGASGGGGQGGSNFNPLTMFGGGSATGAGMGPGGTAMFNPSSSSNFGMSAGQLAMQGGYGGGGLHADGTPTDWIGGVRGGNSPGGLLGPGTSSASGGLFGMTGKGGIMGMIGSMLPMLGGALGTAAGGQSMGGQIMGGVGGMAGGILGGIATGALNAGTMLGGVFGAGGALGIGGLGAAMSATVVLAPIAAALLIGAFLLGRNNKRRQEETIRNTAMLDAFAALDKLIADVGSDKIDGASALEQASTIRKNYLEQMSQLKDKKTRNIALKDVSRIDSKIAILTAAVSSQVSRKARLELMVPTFASGGAVSMGFQAGGPSVGYFPAAGGFASFNERGSEYILDAQTTRNVGVSNLDALRSSKGSSFASMRRNMPMQGYSSGGSVQSGNGGGAPVIEMSVQVGLATEQFVRVIDSSIRNNDGSRQQISVITKSLQDQGPNAFSRTVYDQGSGQK